MCHLEEKLKICLIKTVELTEKGWQTSYHTEINNQYATNSTSSVKKEAECFFEKALKNKGVTKIVEIIREETIDI